MRKISSLFVLLILIPITLSVKLKEEIYSAHTSNPSFLCPSNVERCEIYEVTDAMSRKIDPPILIKVCEPSTTCEYVKKSWVVRDLRILPGDVCFSASTFKGYKIIDVENLETTTTIITSTTTPTTTIPSKIEKDECKRKSYNSCIKSKNCEWVFDYKIGFCREKLMVSTATSQTSTTTTTTTSTTTRTTTTICLPPGTPSSSPNKCCSRELKDKIECGNQIFNGFCFFPTLLSVCR
ncbi:MAG: hypothetical protein QXY45_03325 [Candidatus Aenigmatarchaeota archaeon]